MRFENSHVETFQSHAMDLPIQTTPKVVGDFTNVNSEPSMESGAQNMDKKLTLISLEEPKIFKYPESTFLCLLYKIIFLK